MDIEGTWPSIARRAVVDSQAAKELAMKLINHGIDFTCAKIYSYFEFSWNDATGISRDI